MARKTEKVTIDGHVFQLTQFGAIEGLRVSSELLAALGPVVRSALEGLTTTKDAEVALAKLVLQALESLGPERIVALAEKFAPLSQVQMGPMMMPLHPTGPDSAFDQFFAGQTSLIIKWLFACVKFNFADFLSGSVASIGQPAAMEQSA